MLQTCKRRRLLHRSRSERAEPSRTRQARRGGVPAFTARNRSRGRRRPPAQESKARLEALLDSDDESKALAAARSLYSYSPSKAPDDEESEPAPKDALSALKVILRQFERMNQSQLEQALDREGWNAINRIGTRDPELARAFEAWTAKLAEMSGRRGPAVRVEDGRLVADGPEPPAKPAVPAPAAEPALVPSAPSLPSPGPGAREQLEAGALNGIRERISWEFEQDWQRPPSPAELDERVRRARGEALEDEEDVA